MDLQILISNMELGDSPMFLKVQLGSLYTEVRTRIC